MSGAIVTVTVQQVGLSLDLELPVDLEAAQLGLLLAQALLTAGAAQVGVTRLEAHPPGRFLRPDETLAEAGVWDGSWLVLHTGQPADPT